MGNGDNAIVPGNRIIVYRHEAFLFRACRCWKYQKPDYRSRHIIDMRSQRDPFGIRAKLLTWLERVDLLRSWRKEQQAYMRQITKESEVLSSS